MKILIWNVQGLRKGGWMEVAKQILALKADISILTETNLLPSQSLSFSSLVPHHFCVSASSIQRGTGVTIVLGPSCETVSNPIQSNDGRKLEVAVKYRQNTVLNILAIYAPGSKTQREDWYNQLLSEELSIPQIDIFAGDFNCILDPADTDSPYDSPPPYSEKLKHFNSLHGLVDIVATNFKYTYTHRSSGHHFRLDRIHLRSDLVSLISSAHTLTAPKSDHRILLIDLVIDNDSSLQRGPGIWRLKRKTLNNSFTTMKISSIISSICNQSMSNLKKWLEIKKQSCSFLSEMQKQLDTVDFGIEKSIRQTLNSLNTTDPDIILSHFPNNSYFQNLVSRYKNLLNDQQQELKIKAKMEWDLHSELPSKFLSHLLKTRNRQHIVRRVRHPSTGVIVSSQHDILDAFHTYYSQLFSRRVCNSTSHHSLLEFWKPPPIPFDQLIQPITTQETISVINNINPDKAPGMDGLSGLFYKQFQDLLAPLLTDLFNDFLFGRESIPEEMKYGVITTIYKQKGDPLDLENRRPITLLNIDYKLYSKIINQRLKLFLSHWISPYQNGFVKNRLIFDNVIVLQSAMEIFKNTDTIYTFIDFRKAFDSVSHAAILRTLNYLQLPSCFINTIMDMLSNTKVKVSVNGYLTDWIDIQRGTKQGDPISPTLFVLVIECLSRAISSSDSIIGLKLGDLSLKHLLYADDLLIFSNGMDDLRSVLKTLDLFCNATALEINKSKSKHILASKHRVSVDLLPFEVTEQEKYLGYQFNCEGIVSIFSSLFQQIHASLERWKSLVHIISTKATILKTYAFSKLNYYLYGEPLQNSRTYNNLHKLAQWFLWSKDKAFSPTTHFHSPISWDRLQLSPIEGGFGFPNFAIRHKAFKAWLLQRALNNTHILYSTVWKQWFQDPRHAPSSFFKEVYDSWSFFNLQPSSDSNISLKDLYKNWFTAHKKRSLTPSQQLWQSKFSVNYDEVWKTIHFFRNAPRLKNLLWRIYSKTLPLYKGNHPLALCDHCSNPESTIHLFFECERTLHIIELIRPYWEDWLGLPLNWSPSSILPLKSHKHQPMFLVLVACTFWTIWTCRNLSKINSTPPNSNQIVHTFKIEMARFLTAEYNVQRESYLSKLPKYPPISSSSQTLNSKSFFPLHSFTFYFLIPHHFIITSINSVIPVDSNLQ
jgi:exonuclease III